MGFNLLSLYLILKLNLASFFNILGLASKQAFSGYKIPKIIIIAKYAYYIYSIFKVVAPHLKVLYYGMQFLIIYIIPYF